MKPISIFVALFVVTTSSYAQRKITLEKFQTVFKNQIENVKSKSTPEKSAEKKTSDSGDTETPELKLKGFNAGLAIGPSLTLNQNLLVPGISPIDNTLVFDKSSLWNFTLTSVFMLPLSSKSSVFKKADEGKLKGVAYQEDINTYSIVPTGVYAIFNINLVDLAKAADVRPFNQSIAGGIGFGYRFNQRAMLAATVDFTNYKQPKGFLKSLEGQVLKSSDGSTIKSIDKNDANYFNDVTAAAISLRFVYIFSANND